MLEPCQPKSDSRATKVRQVEKQSGERPVAHMAVRPVAQSVERPVAHMAVRPVAQEAAKVNAARVDEWRQEGACEVRIHNRDRRELFTLLRVEGSPPARSLFTVRITQGTYRYSNKDFSIIDAWTDRQSAHRVLDEPWTGSTYFIRRPREDIERSGRASEPIFARPGSAVKAASPVGGSEVYSDLYLSQSSQSSPPVCCRSRHDGLSLCTCRCLPLLQSYVYDSDVLLPCGRWPKAL
jgi:hypothetical protein